MSTPNDKFFEKLFMAVLFALKSFLPEIWWDEVAEEIFFFNIRFVRDV